MSEETKETKDIKITRVEKAKDPRRVEAGKKLGAISRQAKEKKMHEKKVEEFELPTFDSSTIAVGIAGVVGMVVYLYHKSSSSSKESPNEDREDHLVVREDREEPAKQVSKVPARKELDTLD